MIDILLIVALIYCFGALVGGGVAFVRAEKLRKTRPLTLSEEGEALEQTIMWTLFWWYCLWNWLAHRNAFKR
jgi:hypothetical protein